MGFWSWYGGGVGGYGELSGAKYGYGVRTCVFEDLWRGAGGSGSIIRMCELLLLLLLVVDGGFCGGCWEVVLVCVRNGGSRQCEGKEEVHPLSLYGGKGFGVVASRLRGLDKKRCRLSSGRGVGEERADW